MALTLNGSTGVVEANIADSAITSNKIASVAASKLTGQVADANAPSGSIVQVVQSVRTDGFTMSITANTWATIPSFSASITPQNTTNKILISVVFGACYDNDHYAFRLQRDGGSIAMGTGGGDSNYSATMATIAVGANLNGTRPIPIQWLDSPNTSSTVSYTVDVRSATGGTMAINRSKAGSANGAQTPAVIILMEIAS